MSSHQTPSIHDAPDEAPDIDGFSIDVDYADDDAISPELNELYKEHRKKFNQKAFGLTDARSTIHGRGRCMNKRIMSKDDYDNHIDVLRYWNVEEGHTDLLTGKHISQEEFRRGHGKHWYRLSKKYKVFKSKNLDGTETEQLKRQDDKTLEWKIVVHEENAYDAILDCHETVGHKKVAATKNEATKLYWNITEELCKLFVKTCPECSHEPPPVKKMIGAKNPIYSGQFRDRFQADLIDYRSNPKRNSHGVEMKWLLVLKDHFTKYTMLRPLPKKEAKMVAEELAYMFAAIGYPLVFQTDNGSEFTADVVLKMVREWNSSCKTVTGRRRTPRDQGSVERTNASIKTVIAKLEQKERNRGNRDPNWVKLAPIKR